MDYRVLDRMRECPATDLVSLGYAVLALKRQLPWTPKKAKNFKILEEFYDYSSKTKKQCSIPHLCQCVHLKNFEKFLTEVGTLAYDTNPDYKKYENWF